MLDVYEKISSRWNRVEGLLKKAERVRGEVIQPSINELRYAGRRFVDAILVLLKDQSSAEAQAQARDFLNEAFYFCMRAEHDCVDAIILHLHTVIKKYDEIYDRDMLAATCPNLKNYRAEKADIDALIAESREVREKRDAIYQDIIRDKFDFLILVCDELERAKDVLQTEAAKRLKRYEDIERRAELSEARAQASQRQANISLWVGVVGLGFGALGLAATILGFIMPR